MLVVLISTIPPFPSFANQEILSNDVILYHLPIDSYWLDSLDLQLLGQQYCSTDAVSIECEDLPLTTPKTVTLPFVSSDSLYLTEGSFLFFTLYDTILQCQYCRPFYIWIFTNLNDAERNSENDFEDLACSKPPEGSWCLQVDENSRNASIYIEESSYYYVRCEKDSNCSAITKLTVSGKSEYNYEEAWLNKIDSVHFGSGEGKMNLKLKRHKFFPLLESLEEETCVLLKLNENCQSSVNHVTAQGFRRWDLMFYPCLILVVVCFPFFIGCLVCKFKEKRKKSAL